jgi:hypothetical protein
MEPHPTHRKEFEDGFEDEDEDDFGTIASKDVLSSYNRTRTRTRPRVFDALTPADNQPMIFLAIAKAVSPVAGGFRKPPGT